MKERPHPLGKNPFKVAISREELELLYQHREKTGEPMQSFVRRLIRENADYRDPLPEDLTPPPVVERIRLSDVVWTAEERAEMTTYEMTDVPKRRACLTARRDVRSPRRRTQGE